MITEGEQKIIKLLERMATNYPSREDVRFFSGDADTAPLGSTLTVTWTLRTDFEIVIDEMYADAKDDCTYDWRYSGNVYPFNEVNFSYGKRVTIDMDTLVLVVTNAGAVNQAIGYYLRGWARLKLGGIA